MIIIPNNEANEPLVNDALMDSSMSFRKISLYGRSLFITNFSSTENMEYIPIKDAMVISDGLYSRKVKKDSTNVTVGKVKIGYYLKFYHQVIMLIRFHWNNIITREKSGYYIF